MTETSCARTEFWCQSSCCRNGCSIMPGLQGLAGKESPGPEVPGKCYICIAIPMTRCFAHIFERDEKCRTPQRTLACGCGPTVASCQQE